MLSTAGPAAAAAEVDAATVSGAGVCAAMQATRAVADSSASAGSGMNRMILVLSVRRHGDREVGRSGAEGRVAAGIVAVKDVEDVVVRSKTERETFVGIGHDRRKRHAVLIDLHIRITPSGLGEVELHVARGGERELEE